MKLNLFDTVSVWLSGLEISKINKNRIKDSFYIPQEVWIIHKVNSLLNWEKDYRFKETFFIKWKSVFWNKDTSLRVKCSDTNEINWIPLLLKNTNSKFNNISLNRSWKSIKIIEHISSIYPWLGINANYELTWDNSFPNYNNWLFDFTEQIINWNFEQIWDSEFITVKEPILFEFWEGYLLFEPDNWDKKLIIDYQFLYKNSFIWEQRIEMEVNPGTYAFISKRRTLWTWYRTTVMKLLWRLWKDSIPFLWLWIDNVLFSDKIELLNSNQNFDFNWINREALFHWIIDKLGALGLLEKRFVWKLTTHFAWHKHDIEALKYLKNEDLLIKV